LSGSARVRCSGGWSAAAFRLGPVAGRRATETTERTPFRCPLPLVLGLHASTLDSGAGRGAARLRLAFGEEVLPVLIVDCRGARRRSGMTQAAWADALYLSLDRVRALEYRAAANLPSLETAYRMAVLAGLLTMDGPEGPVGMA